MQTRTLTSGFEVTLVTLAFILLNNAIAQQPSVSSNADYFDHITLFSQGRITRFTRMPIRVYISPVLKDSPYLSEIRYAMQEWHVASDGDIRFEETDVPHNVDIRVSWGYTGLLADFQDTRLGSAELTRLTDSTQIDTSPERAGHEFCWDSREPGKRNGTSNQF